MMLPNISTVYRKTAELITTKNDKAYCMHMNTIHSISDRAHRENWTSNQRIGAIAQDFANINSGIEHDYVTNTLKGGDESHSIATLSRMFLALAQTVKDAGCNEDDGVHQNSILDNLPFWRCPTDGGRQHQQVNGSRVRPSRQEGKHFQHRQILSSWQ